LRSASGPPDFIGIGRDPDSSVLIPPDEDIDIEIRADGYLPWYSTEHSEVIGGNTVRLRSEDQKELMIRLLRDTTMAHSQAPPFNLTLSAVEPRLIAGSPVDLEVVMTNTSNHEVDCTSNYSNALDRNYLYDVRDAEGWPVPRIEKKYHGGFNIWPCTLKPGQSDNPGGGRISILYDFSQPGKYTIQVSRAQWGDENRPETAGTNKVQLPFVKSNTISIEVLPGGPASSRRHKRPGPEFTLALETKRPSIESGQRVVLKLTRKNRTHHTIDDLRTGIPMVI
jgi:hypothetical protein